MATLCAPGESLWARAAGTVRIATPKQARKNRHVAMSKRFYRGSLGQDIPNDRLKETCTGELA
jgi:hypothetical protein